MGMRANAELGYGLVIDEDKAYDITNEVFDEDEDDAYFTEYIYDLDGLDFIRSGADGCERFVVCIKDFTYSADWGEFFEIPLLHVPKDLSALDKFCDKHNLEKNYAWHLGAYFG
jgi:hypothetical protein